MTDLDRHGSRPAEADIPDGIPVLSRGKHRRPSEGGCFMEFASFLAGEAWSDHPDCTHPLLASLARLVNDAMTDEGRAGLVPLVPEVIGLQSEDPRLYPVVARRCALRALPVAPYDEQRALAVAVLAAERVLARLDGRPTDMSTIGGESAAVLATAPVARDWAIEFSDQHVPGQRPYRRHAAPTAVRCAVQATVAARLPDPDAALHDLLASAVAEARVLVDHEAAHLDQARWTAGCDLLDPVAP